jgi:heat shock protein HslJ
MRGIRVGLVGVLLAGSLSLPLTAVAQVDPVAPESVDWRLTAYLDPAAEPSEEGSEEPDAAVADVADELTVVPLGTQATLRLEGGQASGWGGCNTFSGSYALDGTSLTFADVLATAVACADEDIQTVEDAYLGLLPNVRGWLISGGALSLTDEAGATILTFEVPDISLTSSELANLVATLETLGSDIATLREDLDTVDEDVSRLGVARLRERIRVLEQSAQRLERQLDARPESTPPPSGGFSAPERVLLEAIPTRIASRCVPLRSRLPAGTRAAVTCNPDTVLVSSLDYFLMEGRAAADAFTATMDDHGVPEATGPDDTCAAGRRSQQIHSGGFQAEGCYRSGGKAALRFVDNATTCRQLPVGEGRRLRNPALYMAVAGTGNDIARLHAWAGGTDDAALTRLSRHIERDGQPRSPGCIT